MIGGASGEFRNTGSAAASSAWACLVLFVLVFAGVLIGAVSLILIGACFSAKPQSLAGPATPFGTILAVRWPNKGWSRPVLPDHGELAASEQAQLEAARARRGWRPISRALTSQFNTSTHRRRSFQLPPRSAASGFQRCFHSAAWLPARSSFRLKARLLRRFHRAGQQPTPRGAASGAKQPPPRGARLNGAQRFRKHPTRGAPLPTSPHPTRRSTRSQAARTSPHQPAPAPLVRPHRSRLRHGDSDPGRGRPRCATETSTARA